MPCHCLILLFTLLLALFRTTIAQCPAVEECLSGDTCPVLPFPVSAIPRRVPNRGFSLAELRPGVYTFFDGAYRALILYKEGRLTAVDFPEGSFRNDKYLPTLATLQVLKGQTPHRLDMVYSHRHLDHIGGSGKYYTDMKGLFPGITVNIWGTRETEEFTRRLNSTIPDINILVSKRGRTVNLAESLELKLVPVGGHTLEDLSCHVLPSSDGPGVMHFVDVVTPGVAPFFSFGITIDLGRYITAQEELLELDWKFLSGGHGRMGRKRDLRVNVEYTKDAVRFLREAAEEVTPEQLNEAGLGRVGDPTAVEFGNGGLAFKIVVETQSRLCARKLIQKYGCQLGQVATFGESHCVSAFFFDLVDA